MKKLNYKIFALLLIVTGMLVACSGCNALIPNTDDANMRLRAQIVPGYKVYVKADKTLTPAQKAQRINAIPGYDYNMLCAIIVPAYIKYVKSDSKITDKVIRTVLIENAQSYIDLNNHAEKRCRQ